MEISLVFLIFLLIIYLQTWTLGPVEEGNRIKITFLHFDIEDFYQCGWDYVEIDNKKYCGRRPYPWSIISNSSTVNITFQADWFDALNTGFLAVWTPYDVSTDYGCSRCTFPFVFGNATFDTCISVHDVDTQPWCLYSDFSTIVDDSTKVPCSDSDSSCPSTPPQMIITSPNYPLQYPNNVDQVI